MRIATFDYTDAQGKETKREVLVIGQPTDKLTGYTLEELDAYEQGALAERMNALKQAYDEQVLALLDEFDLKKSFRQFKDSNISNLVTEVV